MRLALLVLPLFCVAALAAPAHATAHHQPTTPTIRHLRAQVRALRARVRVLTAERNAIWTSLATADGQPARAKPPVITTPLAVAIKHVRHEVQWAQGSTTAPLGGQLVAQAAMDYVVGHVSTGAYGYLELVHGETPGGPDLPSYYESVNMILATQVGICVQAERTFAAIVKALGFRVRDIGFDFIDPNGEPDAHAAAEVYYDGSWHFFDPTFGQFWTDTGGKVLSIADIRASGGIEHRDDASFTNVIEDTAFPTGDDTWFETDPSTFVSFHPQG